MKNMGVELPQEIVVEILLRVLPVKSLVRFKCACKSWCSMISDPYFIRKHVNHVNFTNSNTKNNYESDILLFPDTSTFKSMVCDDDNDRIVTVKELDFPLEIRSNAAKLVGSCDGLLCVVTCPDSFVLWNPSIKEFKKLPLPDDSLSSFYCDPCIYGLGSDSSLDDYKVLRALPNSKAANILVELFTLKTNSWRRIPREFPFPYEIHCRVPTTFTNGGIHCLGTHAILQKPAIVCFDVVKEEFKEVPLPDDDKVFTHSLQLLRGCLCVDRIHPRSHLVLWVMKEYGVKETWIKLLTVPNYPGPDCYFDLMPLCLTKNGVVLLRTREFFPEKEIRRGILYRPTDDTFRELEVCGITAHFFLKTAYVESLVSPNG